MTGDTDKIWQKGNTYGYQMKKTWIIVQIIKLYVLGFHYRLDGMYAGFPSECLADDQMLDVPLGNNIFYFMKILLISNSKQDTEHEPSSGGTLS